MKILCPTDFSNTSINAIKWAIAYLESIGGGEIEILHCLDIRSRGDVFLDLNVLLREPAEEDFYTLTKELKHKKSVKLKTKILNASPKISIPKRAKKINADLIAIGTTGLTNLKNVFVGSVTDYIVRHSKLPVISIPNKAIFRNFNKIVIGADEKQLKKPEILDGIKKFVHKKKVKLHIAQVFQKKKDFIKVDGQILDELENLNVEVKPIPFDESISNSLNRYAEEIKAQIMCIIHHKKKWFRRIFHHSIMKEELFNQELPILFIPD